MSLKYSKETLFHVFRPYWEFSLIYEDVTIASENLCSAFMTIEQWDLFNLPRAYCDMFLSF